MELTGLDEIRLNVNTLIEMFPPGIQISGATTATPVFKASINLPALDNSKTNMERNKAASRIFFFIHFSTRANGIKSYTITSTNIELITVCFVEQRSGNSLTIGYGKLFVMHSAPTRKLNSKGERSMTEKPYTRDMSVEV